MPTIYTTVRVFFLGQLPGEYSFSSAGQLSWVNLLYEILSEAIVFPLFFFSGKVLTDKTEFANRMRTGLLVSVGSYTVLSVIIIALANPLLSLIATDKAIIDASATYIRIESVASIFSLAFTFIMVGMVTLGKEKYVYALTAVKLVLCLLVDMFLVSTLPVSLNLGVNGDFVLLLHAKDRENLIARLKTLSYLAGQYKSVNKFDIILKYGIFELLQQKDATVQQAIDFAYEDYATLRKIVDGLHRKHFKCSIDDFGCGYSSYRILKSLPMDEIKLDKFFLEQSDLKAATTPFSAA